MENVGLSRASPSMRNAKGFSQASSDSRKPISSSSIEGCVSNPSVGANTRRDPDKTNKMGAIHQTNPRLEPQRGVTSCLLSNERTMREQGSRTTRLHENDPLKKEVQLMRRKKAVPSVVLALASPSRKVNSYEKTVRVLSDSDKRRQTSFQGYKTPSFPPVKGRSVLYFSYTAAVTDHTSGLKELTGAKEVCVMCSQPVHTVERMTIQNIPLHRTCFCCHQCGKKLSLLNYATSNRKFYCKVHYKQLSEVKGKNEEENINSGLKKEPRKRTAQQNPRLTPKNVNDQVGKTLIQEKMKPRLTSFYPEVNLRSFGQTRSQGEKSVALNMSRTSWLPLNKTTEDVSHSSGMTKKLLPDVGVILHSWNKAEGSSHKTLEDKAIADKSAQAEKKESQLARFTKEDEDVLRQIRTVGRNRNPEVLEKRQLFGIKNFQIDQARKERQSISGKATISQHIQLKWKERVPVVSRLPISPKISSFSSFPSCSEPLRNMKGTHLAVTEVAAADNSRPSRVLCNGKLSRSSYSKGTADKRDEKQMLRKAGPLLSTRIMLPVMASPERKLPETYQSNTMNALGLKEAKQLNHTNAELKKGHNPSQTKPEMSVCLSEYRDKENSKSLPDDQRLASYPDSLCSTSSQAMCSSNPPKLGHPKKEIGTPVTKSEEDLQDSEDGENSRNGQRENLPSLDSDDVLHVNTFPAELGTDISSSLAISPGTKKTEDPKPTTLNMETQLRNHNKAPSLTNFQNDLTGTGKTLAHPMGSLVEISSEVNVASRDDLNDQVLHNTHGLEGRDLELKDGDIPLLNSLEENDVQLLEQDHQIPDMRLFFVGAEVPVTPKEGDQQCAAHFSIENPPVEKESYSTLSSSENLLQINGLHPHLEHRSPTLIINDYHIKKDFPETGTSGSFQHRDSQFCIQFGADNPSELGLHKKKATTDNYPTRGDGFPSLGASLQHIPELLRDTIQSKAENRDVAMRRPQEHLLPKGESICLSRSLP